MPGLAERLASEVDATIQRLTRKSFKPDPIAGAHFSKIVSLLSSSYKRHGYILQRAILERLKENPDFIVWDDPVFAVSQMADHIIDVGMSDPLSLLGNDINYITPGHRTLQVDALVYDQRTKSLRAYEVKRGAGAHDSGKRRSILRDVLCVQVLLRSYGRERGYDVATVESRVIFYYGELSVPRPFGMSGADMDEHFGFPVWDEVEAVNQHYKERLFRLLSA
jgi:hypothetical protein